jgi:hypothetical protein
MIALRAAGVISMTFKTKNNVAVVAYDRLELAFVHRD